MQLLRAKAYTCIDDKEELIAEMIKRCVDSKRLNKRLEQPWGTLQRLHARAASCQTQNVA